MAFKFNIFTGTFDIDTNSTTVGSAVSGGTADCVLYVDSSGNLATNTALKFFLSGLTYFLVVDGQINCEILDALFFSTDTITFRNAEDKGILFCNGGVGTGWMQTDVSNLAWDYTNLTLSSPIVNATTGFRIANAAASGKFLIGDGTNFINSTSTIPTSAGATANKILLSNGTNYVLSTPTFPNASATSLKHIRSDGTNWIASTVTYPDASVTAGKVIRSDGTNYAASTFTIPDTYSQGDVLYGSASNVLTALAKDTNATRYLANSGSSNNPAWAQVDLTNGVTGALPVANGGTGDTTGGGQVPVGGTIGWLKSLSGTPALTANFVECNGQSLSDSGSVYNGATLPNLNASGGGTKRFLRGSTTSGTTGGADTYTPAGTLNGPSTSFSACAGPTAVAGSGHIHTFTGTNAGYLPSYYEVVWIMRVK